MSPGATSRHQVTSGPTTQQPQRAGRHHDRAEGHRDPRPDPLAERAAAGGEEQHADGDRQGRQPGLERVVAADGLELQDEEEQDRAERGVDEQRHQVGGAEGPVGEEAERHHRLARAAFDHHEGDRRDQRRRRPPTASPAPRVGQRPGECRRARARRARRRRGRSGRARAGRGVSGTHRCASHTVSAASGRLIRKIQRHDAWSTSSPPTSGPSAAAMPPSPDQAPIARLRSSERNAPWIIARLPGVSSAPPMPCSTRAAISTSAFGASPHSREARANQIVPMTKTRRRPSRSPSDPAEQDQRGHGEEVAVGDPLQLRQRRVEVGAHRPQGDVDHRAVEQRQPRAEGGRGHDPPRGRRTPGDSAHAPRLGDAGGRGLSRART